MPSLFSMLSRDKAEDQLGEFLSWLLTVDRHLGLSLLQAANLPGVDDQGLRADVRAGGVDGIPDRVLRGTSVDGSKLAVIIEWKLMTITHGPHQLSGYAAFAAAQPEEHKAAILVAPKQVLDCCVWPAKRLALEDLLAILHRDAGGLPWARVAEEVERHFVGYAVTAASLDDEFERTGWPAMVHLCADLAALVTEYSGGTLVPSILNPSRNEEEEPWYGFYYYSGDRRAGWVGFHSGEVRRDRHYFTVVPESPFNANCGVLYAELRGQAAISSLSFRSGAFQVVIADLAAQALSARHT